MTIDPALVPSYLRPHILPPIRPVFFDDPGPPFPLSSSSTSALTALSSELGRATAEITALRMSSATWRRRAEVHAAANAGLLGFARAAKDHALGMRAERDDALGRCAVLRRKLAELMCVYFILHPAPNDLLKRFCARPEADVDALAVTAERDPVVQQGPLPVFLMQPKSSAQFYEGAADRVQSHSETQMKENPPGGVPVVFGPNVIPAASHTDSEPAPPAAPDE